MEIGRFRGEKGRIVDREAALTKKVTLGIRLNADEKRRVEDLPVRIMKAAFVHHWFAVTQAWKSPTGEGIECWPDPRARYGLYDGRLWLEVDPKRSAEVQLVEVVLAPANILVRLIHKGQLFTIHI